MGTSMGESITRCPSCNTEMPVSALLCPQCGRPNVSDSYFAPREVGTAGSSPQVSTGSSGQAASVTVPSAPPSGLGPAPAQAHPDGKPVLGVPTLNIPRSTEIPRIVLPWETGPNPAHEAEQAAHEPQAHTQAQAPATPHQQVTPPRTVDDLRRGQAPQYAQPNVVAPPQQAWPQQPYQQGDYDQSPQQGHVRRVQANNYYAGGQGYAQQPQAQPPGYNYDPAQYAAYGPDTYRSRPLDPNKAFFLELLGYVGVLGVGHMYGKHIGRGLALLIGWWIAIITLCSTSFGEGQVNSWLLLAPAVPFLSGLLIRGELDKTTRTTR